MTNWDGCTTSAPKTGPTVDFMGMTLAFRLTGKDTGGTFSITDQYTLPGAGPNFLHAHPAHETFIVMEGEFEFYGQQSGKKVTSRLGPGSIHHVASNAPHALKNAGKTMGRLLLIFHPGDIQESFFQEIGRPSSAESRPEPIPQGPPPPELLQRWMDLFAKHKVTLLEQPKF